MTNDSALLVDDEASVIEGLEVFLEDEGFDVYTACSGMEGLALFHSERPNLVITDLKMPRMSGLELIDEIRKLDTQTPVVVLTGYGTLESAIDAIRLNIFDFIQKPVDIDELKETLDRVRAAHRAAGEVQSELRALREKVRHLRTHLAEQHDQLLGAEPLIQSGRELARVLHELNSPLTYIMGVSELLQMIHPDMDKIKAIHEQALRMDRIITSMTRRFRDSLTRQRGRLNLMDLLREEVLFLEMTPELQGQVQVSWDARAPLPEVIGCPAEFSQIFGNLLRNAAEAMVDQPVKTITISSRLAEDGVHIGIADRGPGVPDELRGRIFEPFFTTKTDRGGNYGGLGVGIGLYHCQELIQGYQGSITCRNAANGGAVFEVVLPPALIVKGTEH